MFLEAGLLVFDGQTLRHDLERTKAMLVQYDVCDDDCVTSVSCLEVLTAIHDIMKNPHLLPTVDSAHAPYEGHDAGVWPPHVR